MFFIQKQDDSGVEVVPKSSPAVGVKLQKDQLSGVEPPWNLIYVVLFADKCVS